MHIICLGDSLTYGYQLPAAQSWVSQLSTLAHLDLINKGVPGDTTLDMKKRFNTDVLMQHPDQLIFMGGTNDLFIGRTVDETLTTIDEIIRLCHTHHIPVILLTPLPVNEKPLVKSLFPSADYHLVNQNLTALRRALTDYAHQEHIPICFTGEAVASLPDLKEHFLRDGIHVKSNVYTLIAQTLVHSNLL